RFLLAGAYFLQGLGLTLFLLNQTIPMIYVWFIFHGIGMGAGFGVRFPLRARYFGRKAFGSISGSASLFMMPVGAIVPIYLGWVYDTTGSYISAFQWVAILIAVGVVIVTLIVPPKPPEKISDIKTIV
ncbi:MFS transporter, partial [Chloroflexota bacterium]